MTSAQHPHNDLELSADDQRLLDALVEAGFDPAALGRLPPADAQRVTAISSFLGLMNDYPVEDADHSLVHATLARIDQYEDERAERMNVQARRDREGFSLRRIRLPDFITVAAVLLIGVSVMWPTFSFMRQRSMDSACANNMRQLAVAFGQYAYDNNSNLPVAMAGPFGGWDTLRNVLNLEPLVQGNYCQGGHLNCPGHHEAGPSYSYRWFVPAGQSIWGGPRATVVLGDRNPIVDAARSGRYMPPLSMSINHAGRGQNVLASDGGTLWLEEPVFGRGDNIWLPNTVERLSPGMQPTDPFDAFLLH